MAKSKFSSTVGDSLIGRKTESPVVTPSEEPKEELSVSAKPEELIKRKSNAGRKKIADSKKKRQLVLTLTPETYNRLMDWADKKARTAPNYVSEFVEEHIEDIISK